MAAAGSWQAAAMGSQIDHLRSAQMERQRCKDTEAAHEAEAALAESRVRDADAEHSAQVTGLQRAHVSAIARADARASQAEVLVTRLKSEHAEEIRQCDEDFDKINLKQQESLQKASSMQSCAAGCRGNLLVLDGCGPVRGAGAAGHLPQARPVSA